jgi:glycosyltransferase involved in cell wall biosynthesis
MHIAFWSPAWPLAKFQNGVITYVHWMKQGLERQGHRVSVFTKHLDDSTNESNVHLVREGPRRLRDRILSRLLGPLSPAPNEVFRFSAAIAAEISRVHRQDPIDIIDMEESFGWFADFARRTALPLVVRLHGPGFLAMTGDELDTAFGREKIEREGQALRLASAIAAPSQVTLTQTIQRYGLTPKEAWHIVNPLDMDGNTPQWSLERCGRDTILFVGRFDLIKGADVLLKAFLTLLQERPKLTLIFVGPDSGLIGPDQKRTHFEEYCASLFPAPLRGRVDYRGPVGNRQVADLRVQAMVTVVASRWESQGYTLLEAMLQGCPVVSTDAGGCAESVIDGVTGRLARSEDVEDYADQLRLVLNDPQGAAAMGAAARRHVSDEHSAAKVAAKSVELYQRVIAARAR